MAKMEFKKGKGWREFSLALDPGRMNARLREEIRKANGRIALEAQRVVKDVLQKGAFEANAALTLELKAPNTRPLTDTGRWLWQQIGHEEISPFVLFVGVKMEDKSYSIIHAIHEGATIKVSEKMRFMFRALWRKSLGRDVQLRGRAKELWRKKPGGWKALKSGTTEITIPPRPFFEIVFDSEELQRYAQAQWEAAVAKAMGP